MTRRFSITLPDDVAEMLDEQENASAFIADALRRTRQRVDVRTWLAQRGYNITDEGVARMRERVNKKRAGIAALVAAGVLRLVPPGRTVSTLPAPMIDMPAPPPRPSMPRVPAEADESPDEEAETRAALGSMRPPRLRLDPGQDILWPHRFGLSFRIKLGLRAEIHADDEIHRAAFGFLPVERSLHVSAETLFQVSKNLVNGHGRYSLF